MQYIRAGQGETLERLQGILGEINKLLTRLRDYIHTLETHSDTAGTIREVFALEENQQALVDTIDRQAEQIKLKNKMIVRLKQAIRQQLPTDLPQCECGRFGVCPGWPACWKCQVEDLDVENAKVNLILFHRENGLSHPDLQGDIDKAMVQNAIIDIKYAQEAISNEMAELDAVYPLSKLGEAINTLRACDRKGGELK